MKPLAIDLFCGLGGWTEGLLAEGYRVVGFDNMQHVYGAARYPAQLVIQDVLTLHGKWFKDAALIVASSPCQEFSYRAMPWKRAKALGPPELGMLLFAQAARIQREASEAAGRYIPMVQENVCGAQKWVGRARWHYGSFYLWGDVPALMPITRRAKVGGFRFDGSGGSFQTAATKVSGLNWSGSDKPGYKAQVFNSTAAQRLGDGIKAGDRNKTRATGGHQWTAGFDNHDTIANAQDGHKQRGSGAAWWRGEVGSHGSQSSARKAASAHIAKIPFELARHIARCWHP